MAFGDPNALSERLTRLFRHERQGDRHHEQEHESEAEALPKRIVEHGDNQTKRSEGHDNDGEVNHKGMNRQTPDEVEQITHSIEHTCHDGAISSSIIGLCFTSHACQGRP